MDRDGRTRVCMMLPKWHVGGAETQVMGLLRNLDRTKFSVSLCLLGRGEKVMEEAAAGCVDDVFTLGLRMRYLPLGFLRLVEYLRDGRFDIVHAHLACADLIGRIAAWFAGVPVRVTTEHGKGLWKSPAQLMLEKAMNRITDVRICVSRDIYRLRMEREGTPAEKLAYIPNGVELDAFGPAGRWREGPGSEAGPGGAVLEEFGWAPGSPLVLSIGRIVEAKNYPMLVEAFSRVLGRIPEARCLVAGDGRCVPELREAISRAGIGDRMKLAGSRSDIARLLEASRLFVLSSDREGLPVTLLEAMASETPVVATRVGGIPEAVADGESALLVEPGDAGALAEAMVRVLSDEVFASRLSSEARRRVESGFSMRSVTRRVEEVYLSALAGKRPPAGGDRRKQSI